MKLAYTFYNFFFKRRDGLGFRFKIRTIVKPVKFIKTAWSKVSIFRLQKTKVILFVYLWCIFYDPKPFISKLADGQLLIFLAGNLFIGLHFGF